MSRTDKTRPWWVKMQERVVEVHDHRNGWCEIAGARPTRATIGWRGRCCYFDATYWDPQLWCGCGMCRGSWGDGRRRQRRAGKRAARLWWRED